MTEGRWPMTDDRGTMTDDRGRMTDDRAEATHQSSAITAWHPGFFGSVSACRNPEFCYGEGAQDRRSETGRARTQGRERGTMARPGRTVFVDVNPLAEKHLTGIGRYTARLALALAGQAGCRGPVRLAGPGGARPRRADWSQDQDLGRWGRQVWRGRRVPLAEVDDPARRAGRLRLPARARAAVPVRGQRAARLHHAGRPAHPRREDPRHVRRRSSRRPCSPVRRGARRLALDEGRRLLALRLPPRPDRRRAVGAEPLRRAAPRRPPRRRRPEVGLVVSTIEPRKNAVLPARMVPPDRGAAGRLGALVGRPGRLADLAAQAPAIPRPWGAAGPVPRRRLRRRRSAGSTGRRAGRPIRRSTRGSGSPCSTPCGTAHRCFPATTARFASSTSPGSTSSTRTTRRPSTTPGARFSAAGRSVVAALPRSTPSSTGTPSPATLLNLRPGSPRAHGSTRAA